MEYPPSVSAPGLGAQLVSLMTRPAAESGWRGLFASLTGALILFGGAALWRIVEGTLLYSADDYNRLGYSLQWAREAYFAPGDHLWLSGNFALLGSLIKLHGDPMTAMAIMSALSWVALGAALWYAARVFSLPVAAVLLTLAFLALHAVPRTVIYGPMPDFLFWALALAAMTAAFEAVARPDESRWRALLPGVLSALATTLRFEGWILVGVLSPVHAWLVFGPGGRSIRFRSLIAASGALGLIFPALWMQSAWRELGSPLAFADNRNNPLFRHYTWEGPLRLDQARETTLGGRLRDVGHMWGYLWQGAWAALPAVVVASSTRRYRGALWALTPGLLWMVVIGIISFKSGISGNAPARLVVPGIAALTLCASAVAVGLMARLLEPGALWQRGLALGLLIALGVATERNGEQLDRLFPERSHVAIDTSAILMGWRMRHELSANHEMLDQARKETIHVWGPWERGAHGEFYAIQAISGRPERYHIHWMHNTPEYILQDPVYRLVLVADLPQPRMEQAGFQLLTSTGNWSLYARVGALTRKIDGDMTALPDKPEVGYQAHAKLLWCFVASPTALDWEGAQAFAKGNTAGGWNDWRIPTEEELWRASAYSISNEPGFDARFNPRHRLLWSSTQGAEPGTRRVVDFSRLFPYTIPERSLAGVLLVRTPDPDP